MGQRILAESLAVTASVSGYGVVTFMPRSGETWHVTAVTVSCETTVLEATCNVYRSNIGPQFLMDKTISGSTGDTSDTIHELNPGDKLIVEWVGADAGKQLAATVRGTADILGGGFSAF